MLLSVSHRFIFIHVNKAAGTSVQRALGPFVDAAPRDSISKLKSKLNLTRDYSKRTYSEHTLAIEFREKMPAETYASFFKFAFVRNPWDWLFSTYNYLRNTPAHRHHQRVLAMRSFAEYADFEIARNNRSQAAFVCDGDDVIVDFVGRFETLNDDFAAICTRLGISASLPHVNKTDHRDYREHYNEKLVDRVGQHWQKDISLFGYEFDGLAPEPRREFNAGL
jgi:hypothetical protein